jgi:hypothetical protein
VLGSSRSSVKGYSTLWQAERIFDNPVCEPVAAGAEAEGARRGAYRSKLIGTRPKKSACGRKQFDVRSASRNRYGTLTAAAAQVAQGHDYLRRLAPKQNWQKIGHLMNDTGEMYPGDRSKNRTFFAAAGKLTDDASA